jgi:hypothetical protein
MKILMKVENVALTLAQPSQVSLRLRAILDKKRRRHPLRRATTVSALLLTAGAVPLLAAAQTQSDSAAQAKENKAPSQIEFLVAGQPLWRMTLTSGDVTSEAPKSSGSASRIDIIAPSGGTILFAAKTLRITGNKVVLNGNVVISVRDKSGKNTTLFKADGATLVGNIAPVRSPNGSSSGRTRFSARAIRTSKDKLVFTGDATLTFPNQKNSSKTLFQFKAETATMDIPPRNQAKMLK